MCKPITLISFLIFAFFVNTAIAQDELELGRINGTKRDTKVVKITALDGKPASLKIIPDYVHRELKMVLLKDTLRIIDFWGVTPDISALNKNFIRINYAVRGGSNLGLENMIILCVSNGRLFPAMHCLSQSHWDDGNTADYVIKIALTGNKKEDFKLKVSVHDIKRSIGQPEDNYNYNNETVLSFDVRNNAFYSFKQILYQNFIKRWKGKKSITQEVEGTCPLIVLGREMYYLIGRKWYSNGRGGELFEVD